MATSPARLAGVGLFVSVTLGLLAVAVFMIGSRQMAFAERFELDTEFAKVTGLQTGALVRVSGAKAGDVIEIVPPAMPAGKFRVRMRVIEALHPLVRTDSVASIDTEGLVGGSFLAISAGTAAAPQALPRSTIAGREPLELADLLQQMNATMTNVNATIDGVRSQMEGALTAVVTTVDTANAAILEVSDDVERMAASGSRVAADVADLTTSVREGRGTVGRLFNDDELYTHVTRIAANADAVTTDARTVVAQARETLASVKGVEGPVAGLADNLRQTLDDARSAMSGFAENMDALRHNFFLRGFFKSRGYYDLEQLSPAAYRAGALARGGRRPVRVWLDAPRVFETTADPERPLLTADGRRELDAAIAPYLDRVADGVFVVEGFAHADGPDRQFVVSRARAASVREYLVGRFHLDARASGVMPLGAGPAQGAPADPWDGIALAFFLKP